MDDLADHLLRIGYVQREPVEMIGEFSVRGGIIDIFPAESEQPIRIELFGDTIEEMRRFDVRTQRSVLKVTSATILPLAEHAVPLSPVSGWEFLRVFEEPRDTCLFDLRIVWADGRAEERRRENFCGSSRTYRMDGSTAQPAGQR